MYNLVIREEGFDLLFELTEFICGPIILIKTESSGRSSSLKEEGSFVKIIILNDNFKKQNESSTSGGVL